MRKLERMPDIILEDRILFGLTKGKHTIISIEDYERVKTRSWAYHKSEYQERAVSYDGRGTTYLHHFILNVTGAELRKLGKEVDHANRNTLDNRQNNLKIVTHLENMWNSKRHIESIGVCYHSASGLWIAYVSFPYGGRVSLGYWRTEARAKEISAMGKELQATCSGIADFKFKWKEIKPRRAYDRSAM
jgi:hypothetical protein